MTRRIAFAYVVPALLLLCWPPKGVAGECAGNGRNLPATCGNLFAPVLTHDVGGAAKSVVAGDFNGDGRIDIAVVTDPPSGLSVLTGDGSGGLCPPTRVETGAWPYAIDAGDLNGDGRDDLVVGTTFNRVLHVFLSEPDGLHFREYRREGSGPRQVELEDVNQDGIIDMVTLQWDVSGVFGVSLGLGDGTFSEMRFFALGGSVEEIAACDLNGDGRRDMVATDRIRNGLVACLGRGDGSFDAPIFTEVGPKYEPRPIATGDFNQDGYDDVVTANSVLDGTVAVFLGRGGGTFSAGREFVVGSFTADLVIADFTGDGFKDIATVGQDRDIVSLLIGLGGGDFGAAHGYWIMDLPLAAVAADLDHDGVPDLVVGGVDAHGVSVLLNLNRKIPKPVPVRVTFVPGVVDQSSGAEWIQARIELPPDREPADVDVASILFDQTYRVHPEQVAREVIGPQGRPALIVRLTKPILWRVDAGSNLFSVTGCFNSGEIFGGEGVLRTKVRSGGVVFPARIVSPLGALPVEIEVPGEYVSRAMVEVFDIHGRLLRSWRAPISGRIVWDGRRAGGGRVASGVYLLRLRCANSQSIVKTVVAR